MTLSDTEYLDLVDKLLQTTDVQISRNRKSVEITLVSYDRSAYGWNLREACNSLYTLHADLVARLLTA